MLVKYDTVNRVVFLRAYVTVQDPCSTLVYSRQCGFRVMNSLSVSFLICSFARIIPYSSRDNTIPSSPSGCQSRRLPEPTRFLRYLAAFFIHSLPESHLPRRAHVEGLMSTLPKSCATISPVVPPSRESAPIFPLTYPF